jgi:2-polyprenyl-6-methoxyphenol hydroxylase-like FAD-dependent oxidoreductase
MGNLDTPFPHLTAIPQWKLEESLISHLSQKIERPATLLSYVQETDHVVAKVQHGDDKENIEEIRARYLIGSDGVHSSVRKGTEDWTFHGVVVNAPFGLADVELEGENLPSHQYFSFINGPKGGTGFIPMANPDGEGIIWRIFFNISRMDTYSDDGSNITQGIKASHDFTEEEMLQMLAERSGPFKVKVTKIRWLTKFGVNERKANGFRRGRAFVMGGRHDSSITG